MKILAIEDNRRLAERIQYYLGKDFIVDVSYTGKDGLARARNRDYTVILLDLNLPDIKGEEVCRTIRNEALDTPVLVLTANSDVATRIALLDIGADDFLAKPFHPDELAARIRALSRRIDRGYGSHVMRLGDLTIDVNRRHVERDGVEISLRRKEFDILEYLVYNRGRTVTRAMILDHVWGEAREGWHSTVDVHIKHLRDKVDRPFKSPLIKTAYGVGYMVDDMT